MKDEIFEVNISLHYKDIDWIAKPFKDFFDPLIFTQLQYNLNNSQSRTSHVLSLFWMMK